MLKASITLNQMDSYKEIVPRPVPTSTTHAYFFFNYYTCPMHGIKRKREREI